MRITVLTPCCNRPEAFALCEKYMKRQTLKPFQWLCIDDDEPKTVCTMGQDYIYRPEFKGPESLKNKVRLAATTKLIKGDAVVVVENDDAYHPRWLEFCAEKLRTYDMIGEGNAIYYNVRGRFWNRHNNMQHASLCATAVHTSILQAVSSSCSHPEAWIDDMLWRKPLNKMVFDPMHTNSGKPMVVGIKGMPGRVGYGWQHVRRPPDAHDDPTLEYLYRLIGNDAENYEQYYDENPL